MTPSQYAEGLVTTFLRCRDVYAKYALKQIFIEDLDTSNRHNVREYWNSEKEASLYDLASHFTSLLRLQGHHVTSKHTMPTQTNKNLKTNTANRGYLTNQA